MYSYSHVAKYFHAIEKYVNVSSGRPKIFVWYIFMYNEIMSAADLFWEQNLLKIVSGIFATATFLHMM